MAANNNFTIIGYVAEAPREFKGATGATTVYVKIEVDTIGKDGAITTSVNEVRFWPESRCYRFKDKMQGHDVCFTGYIQSFPSKEGSYINTSLIAQDAVVLRESKRPHGAQNQARTNAYPPKEQKPAVESNGVPASDEDYPF